MIVVTETLSHLVPAYRGIDVEELDHDRFTFQLEMVHFSTCSHNWERLVDKPKSMGYNMVRSCATCALILRVAASSVARS
jgi:hypothetical protein